MKTTLISLLVSVSALNAFGQTWTAGPKVAFGLSTSIRGNELRVGSNQIDFQARLSTSPTLFGGFVRYDRPHWYGQAEGLLGKIETSLVRSGGSVVGSGGDFVEGKRTDARILAGIKPSPWLRLYAGTGYARLNWTIRDYDREIAFAEQAALERPGSTQEWLVRADFARFNKAVDQSYRRNALTGQVGLGIDVLGFMIDLTYSGSLTPLIDGVTLNNGSYAAKQHYRNLALSLGYQLLPTKTFLRASRKSNRAYERIKRDIPFYRNEFHVSGGLSDEGISSAFVYENRYTRYFRRQLAVTAGVAVARVSPDFETGSLPQLRSSLMLITGVRLLPLYSRRHTIGVITGPTLRHQVGIGVNTGSSGLRNMNGQLVNVTDLRNDSRYRGWDLGWQSSVDYQFAVTDRLIMGPWLRLRGEDFLIPDYASTGLQIGYRF